MRILSPRAHGYIDYLVVALLLLAPSLFGFGGVAATLSYILAVVHFGLSVLTAYPLGAIKAIPFPVHGSIELAAGIFMIVSPWLFGFAHLASAQVFFIASGVAVALVWMVTNYRTLATGIGAGTDAYR